MSKLILVVDGDPTLVQKLESTFLRSGFNVIKSGDGKEGLRLFHDKKPDLAVFGLHIPSLGGMEIFETIVEENEDRKPPCPIFIVSDREEMKTMFEGFYIYDFIGTSFDKDELVAKAEKAMATTHKELQPFKIDHVPITQSHERVLVVDDNEDSLGHIINSFIAKGYTVFAERSGDAGIKSEYVGIVDILYIKWDLMDFPGDHVAKKIKEVLDENGRHVPIILFKEHLSVADLSLMSDMAHEIGIAGVIESKDPHELVAEAHKIFGAKKKKH